MTRVLRIRFASILVLLVLTLLVWLPDLPAAQLANVFSTREDGLLTVAFLDVGQGDAIFIETPDGVQLLIDGGPDSSVLRELGAQIPSWDRSLDLVLATHPDKDHIGGLVDVLARYQVSNLVRTENDSDTAVSSAFIFMSEEEKAPIKIARAGEVISLGASTTLRVFSPASDPSEWESNTSSIVAQLQYGEIEFMLTGDAPISIENYIVETYGAELQSDVLKLGHHGSRTSTSETFLTSVAPAYAVVSAEKNSRYGHPHTEVVEVVRKAGVTLVSTAERGTIVFKSDGKTVWLE